VDAADDVALAAGNVTVAAGILDIGKAEAEADVLGRSRQAERLWPLLLHWPRFPLLCKGLPLPETPISVMPVVDAHRTQTL